MDSLVQQGIRAVCSDGPVMVDLRKSHRDSHAGRNVERKCQTKGCWDLGILLEHRGEKFSECRAHLQIRLDSFDPPVHGSLEERRVNRNIKLDSTGVAGTSELVPRHPSSKDVCFDDNQSCSDSDASTASMPVLHVAEHDELSPKPRVSMGPNNSSVLSQGGVHGDVTDSQMAKSAINLMKHTSRRNSLPETTPVTDIPQRRNSTGVVNDQTVRQKAYSFDDDVAPTTQTSAPSQVTVAHPAKTEPAKIEKTEPVPPSIIQGRVLTNPVSVIQQSGPAHRNIMQNAVSTGSPVINLAAPTLDNNRNLPNVTACPPQSDAKLGLMYPDFLRKRAVPDRHMVVLGEVDHGLLMESDKDRLAGLSPHGDIGALLKLKSDKHDEKEDTWDKLTELSLFALSGFGFFETKLGTGTYNREKKASVIRQSQTDKDWLW